MVRAVVETGAGSHFWLYEIWHPLKGYGYQFWSGVASDISEVTLLAGVGVFWAKHNCHQHRCPRLSWHTDADGHPVCKVHHPDHPARGWFRSNRGHPRHASRRDRLGHGESSAP